MTKQESEAGQGTVESLYPFLYASTSDLPAVLAEVRRSTVAKSAEIMELRRVICARDGARLAECAQQSARQFAAGGGRLALRQCAAAGRLFAFGNGGSATDAQQVATLYLNPGHGSTPLAAFSLSSDPAIL